MSSDLEIAILKYEKRDASTSRETSLKNITTVYIYVVYNKRSLCFYKMNTCASEMHLTM